MNQTTNDRDPIAPAVQKAYAWINEVSEVLGVEDRQRSYQSLRASLHALRDRLQVDEAAQLGAELPTVVRGVYFEGWKPAATPEKHRTVRDFLESLREEVPGMLPSEAPVAAAAVFEVLQRHVSAGEIGDVKGMLPPPIRELWPAAS